MAPKASSTRGKRASAPLPAVDQRLVAPESRYEVFDGKLNYVSLSDEPHGSRHSKLSALLEAYAARDYDVACDMLTRTSETSDVAPDASVFPAARDAKTGGRRLEELAFEIVSTRRLSVAATKARKLTARGVRRVFAIDVEKRRALTWSRPTDGWEILPLDGVIEDRALALPLPIEPLVFGAKVDDAVARALIAKKNPVIQSTLREERNRGRARGKTLGRIEGKVEGKIDARLAVLAGRGLRVSAAVERRIRGTRDEAQLDARLRLAAVCASARELLRTPPA